MAGTVKRCPGCDRMLPLDAFSKERRPLLVLASEPAIRVPSRALRVAAGLARKARELACLDDTQGHHDDYAPPARGALAVSTSASAWWR